MIFVLFLGKHKHCLLFRNRPDLYESYIYELISLFITLFSSQRAKLRKGAGLDRRFGDCHAVLCTAAIVLL